MKTAITLCAVSIASLASITRAQSLLRSVSGPAASAQFGKACITVPDQNGDGFKDVLVGAPGFNGGRGAIYCISGAYLASGAGAQTLWSLAPPVAAGDNFGFALADVGDVTGDNVHDFLVGQPGYDSSTQSDIGAVRLVHGSAHSIVSLITGVSYGGRLGQSIAACGDVNLNGFPDVAVAAPLYGVSEGGVWIVDGFKLAQSGNVQSLSVASFGGEDYADFLGSSIASGVDLTGDGIAEIVAGVPGRDNGGAMEAGSVLVYDVVQNQRYYFDSLVAGEGLGASVSVSHDYDGDGVADIIAGAPNYTDSSGKEVGRTVVLSGARLVAQTPPYEIYNLIGIPGSLSLVLFDSHSGAAVRACADLNGDGVGDILVGALDYTTALGSGTRGYVAIYSGATGVRMGNLIIGATHDHFGDALAGALMDLDGDGFREFVFGGALSNAGGTDSGVLKCYRLFPITPTTYCTGKINSLGCTPSVSFSGNASATSGAPFLVTASNEINQKTGLLFYAHQPAGVFFQGGTKCAGSPTLRTPVQSSGGSTSGSSCTGVFNFDFNALVASGSDPTLVAGSEVYAQYWSRDPASASTTSLSNALRFVINP